LSARLRLFRALARLDVEHPLLVLTAAFILSVLSILYTRARLEFHTGQDDLISGESRDSRNYLRYTHEFPDLDGIVVVVGADNTVRAEAFADALAHKLNADSANVKSVFYRIDTGAFADSALLYLDRAELDTLAERIRAHRDFLSGYAADPRLANFFHGVNVEANRAATSAMMSDLVGGDSPAKVDPALDLGMLDAVLRGMLKPQGARFESPWGAFTGAGNQGAMMRDGYLGTDNGKYLLLQVAPGDGVKDGPDPVDAIASDLREVRAQFPGIDAGMTGGPALARAEESSTAHDVALASILAVASNALLVVIPFGAVVEPAFALITLLVGVTWSFGFTTLAVGHLNLLSAVFTSILAGIGINFPIHLMARYDEARRDGASAAHAVELAVVNTGTGVFASACIMALAFVMPVFSDFRGIAELGLVSAAGLFLCLVSALFVFPALVALRDRNRVARVYRPVSESEPSRLAVLFRRPWAILYVATASALAVLVLAPRVGFDQNLLKLQAQDSEAVRFENKLLKDSGRSSWFAVSMAKSRTDAERLANRYRALAEVSDVETIATYIPDQQAEKRATLASLKPIIDPIRIHPAASSFDPAALRHELEALKFKLGSAAGSDPSGQVANTAALLGDALARDPASFADYDRAMASDLEAKLAQMRRALTPAAVNEQSLPRILRDRFIGSTGAYLVQIYPRGDVWDDAPLARFVAALRTVDTDVTGPPVQTYSIATVMRRGYERAALLALLAVFVFVFADFRNLRDAVLATVPLIFGGAWLLEAMALLGWEFNLANLFAVPIIIGTAVDNGVNMLYRWREERKKGELILTKAVGKSVTIASLTTIAGFAALIPATHRGISSLGLVLSVGVTLILIATVIVLPAMFEVIGAGIDRNAASSDGTADSPRRFAGSGLKLLAIAAAAGVLALYPRYSTAAGADRERSDELVKQAETMIYEAGRSNPLDAAKVNSAIDRLHEALKVDPRNDGAYVDLGFCYGLLRDGNTAVDMYRTATLINPSPANFKELADVYLRIGDAEGALMAANAGLVKDPHNAKLYNAKGMALHDLMRFDEAAQAWRQALVYDPSFEIARRNLEALEPDSAKQGGRGAHQ
jgi:hopanoid biosynthesis associated RND transporter like protein HpnN